jgi:hypothetical protein
MVAWDTSGFDQNCGSSIFFSTCWSCWRTRVASKILPQVFDLFFEGSVVALEFFDGHEFVRLRGAIKEIMAIIAHVHANQSPCRV